MHGKTFSHYSESCMKTYVCWQVWSINRSPTFCWLSSFFFQRLQLSKFFVRCTIEILSGELGIKKPNHMNETFLVKMWWNLIQGPYDLWCRVLVSKYEKNNDFKLTCSYQPYDSSLWKALACLWSEFQLHVVRQIGDGRQTNFFVGQMGT